MSDSVKERVIEAIKTVSKERADILRRFSIILQPDGVEQSYGLWMVPATHGTPAAPYKSLDLNRALEDVQQALEGLTGTEISVFLNHEN